MLAQPLSIGPGPFVLPPMSAPEPPKGTIGALVTMEPRDDGGPREWGP